MGPKDQPDYVNAVMAVETTLPALELLHCLQKIEFWFLLASLLCIDSLS
jgi:7,8-dihydro-6-hydroxymethylpterin-pyrophosphokinase